MKLLLLGFTVLALGTLTCSCMLETGSDSLLSTAAERHDGHTLNCTTNCHGSGSAVDPVVTNGSGNEGKHVRHVSEKGFTCEECHYSYMDSLTHMDARLDTGDPALDLVVFDMTNPGGEWTLDPGAHTGYCSSLSCHGPDTLDWYDEAGWSLPGECAVCHGSVTGTRRQVLGAGGDFNRESHHVIDYGSRQNEIITESDCLVCHTLDYHMSGLVRLNDKDNGGAVIVYQSGTPESLEPFCLSCHDSNGATMEANPFSPFSDTNTIGMIPNSEGTLIKSRWQKSYGHRDKGLTCVGSGEPDTGCHGSGGQRNAHGSSNYGILAANMNFLIEATAGYTESDYDLCFSCHANYPDVEKESILGVAEGGIYDYELSVEPLMGTSLIFGFPPYYNDGLLTKFVDSDGYIHSSSSKYQLHWFHISMRVHGSGDVWLYRGQGASSDCNGCHSGSPPSGRKATCTACHSVHGSNNTIGITYDELNISHEQQETTGLLGIPRDELIEKPMYCGLSVCHSSDPADTNYIFYPTGE